MALSAGSTYEEARRGCGQTSGLPPPQPPNAMGAPTSRQRCSQPSAVSRGDSRNTRGGIRAASGIVSIQAPTGGTRAYPRVTAEQARTDPSEERGTRLCRTARGKVLGDGAKACEGGRVYQFQGGPEDHLRPTVSLHHAIREPIAQLFGNSILADLSSALIASNRSPFRPSRGRRRRGTPRPHASTPRDCHGLPPHVLFPPHTEAETREPREARSPAEGKPCKQAGGVLFAENTPALAFNRNPCKTGASRCRRGRQTLCPVVRCGRGVALGAGRGSPESRGRVRSCQHCMPSQEGRLSSAAAWTLFRLILRVSSIRAKLKLPCGPKPILGAHELVC
jgi:hypothetical protein